MSEYFADMGRSILMDSAFITYASDVLGETNTGLSGSKIAEYSTAYAVKFDVNIPYSNYPFPDSAYHWQSNKTIPPLFLDSHTYKHTLHY